jgi:hypothetical protein
MQTRQIALDKAEAAKLFRKYREHRAYSTPADREIERIAKMVAEGRIVVQGVGSIVAAGVNAEGLPKLAIARADAPTCHLQLNHDGSARMSIAEWQRSRAKIGTSFIFPPGAFATRQRGPFKSAVPLIPPDIRPRRGLENYHILYEAEWRQVVPVDPLLLRRIGKSDLWIVVGAWELTAIERAVVAGRSGLAM